MPRLSPSASRSAWPSVERDVLDRVVLVDVQIAGALHVELEAAVLAELLEHVIEEAEAGLGVRLGFAVEVDGDANVGLASCAGARSPCAAGRRARARSASQVSAPARRA